MRTRRAGLELGARVVARKRGGPWLVSVHGFTQSGEAMASTLRRFEGRMNVLAVDLAGHGHSEGSTDPLRCRADALADDVLCWFDRLQLPPCHLHGYSMGGRVVWRILQRLAEGEAEPGAGLRGVILESAHPGLTDPGERQRRRQLDAQRARALREDPARFLQDWNEMPLFAHDPDPEAPANVGSERLDGDVRAEELAAVLQGFSPGAAPPADLDAVARLTVPLLLLSGGRDAAYTRLLERIGATLPGADHVAVPGAGHRVWKDRAGEWAQHVARFVLGSGEAARRTLRDTPSQP